MKIFLILKNFSKFLENSREISLLDLDLEAFSIHFSLSISILRHFHFTFHSRSRYQGIFISLFILEMSEPDFHFTFHFSNFQYPLSQDTGMCASLTVALQVQDDEGENGSFEKREFCAEKWLDFALKLSKDQLLFQNCEKDKLHFAKL